MGLDGTEGVAVDEELRQRRPRIRDSASTQHRSDDLPAHRAEFRQGPVPMFTHPQVDLGDRIETEPVVRVEQKSDLDAVTRRERNRLQQLPGTRVFTSEGLEHTRQFRPQCGEQGSRDQFGDPATAGGVLRATDPQGRR